MKNITKIKVSEIKNNIKNGKNIIGKPINGIITIIENENHKKIAKNETEKIDENNEIKHKKI